MQLQIDVNTIKSDIFLELLNLFKKDNMINDYRIIDKKIDTDILNEPNSKIENIWIDESQKEFKL